LKYATAVVYSVQVHYDLIEPVMSIPRDGGQPAKFGAEWTLICICYPSSKF